ncbi:MAG: 16S rRNA (cytidine(1402)-2'-O)-methyltransferase [Firmicutes bacterium]|nr:16S rRNA (cytidine(1402)-2'-O)-methyltransferase [Bacillota bacterium]
MGKLFICPTPIGNLEDISYRVLKTLENVDLIAAEDTRHSRKLLNHFEIDKKLVSYHEHNKDVSGRRLVEDMLSGKDIALVSDAGMPGISDPGEDLVKLCISENIQVEVLPGASAFTLGLVLSGFDTSRFIFEGFLSRKKKQKAEKLEELKYEKRTIIFYESPHRLVETLEIMEKVLGNRQISISRELTKIHEETLRMDILSAVRHFNEKSPKGEFVLVLEGSNEEASEEFWLDMEIEEHIRHYMDSGNSKKDAVKMVAKDRGVKKSDIYKYSIDM